MSREKKTSNAFNDFDSLSVLANISLNSIREFFFKQMKTKRSAIELFVQQNFMCQRKFKKS